VTTARELRQAISAQDYVEAERLLLAYTASLARVHSDELPAALELLEWARRSVLAGRAACLGKIAALPRTTRPQPAARTTWSVQG
jgi:hypothetical protein